MKILSIASWSGGKDSCFACYMAKKNGFQIKALFNFAQEDGTHSLSHGLSSRLISKQAALTGIPLVQRMVSWGGYREEFKAMVNEYKDKQGIGSIVFGDIYLREHRDWLQGLCRELEVEAVFPLWDRDTTELAYEIIDSGFEAIVISTQAQILGKEWLKMRFDRKFVSALKDHIDPCGEKGEFHTFVYNCPLFKGALDFTTGKIFKKDEHWFLEIMEAD